MGLVCTSPYCLHVDDFALTSILESEVVSYDMNASNVATKWLLFLFYYSSGCHF